jgi:hypothetical protein
LKDADAPAAFHSGLAYAMAESEHARLAPCVLGGSSEHESGIDTRCVPPHRADALGFIT